MPHISLDRARAAKRTAQEHLEASGQSAAVGITRVDGEYAVKVNLAAAPTAARAMPGDIDGVQVCVEVVGAIRPRSRPKHRR